MQELRDALHVGIREDLWIKGRHNTFRMLDETYGFVYGHTVTQIRQSWSRKTTSVTAVTPGAIISVQCFTSHYTGARVRSRRIYRLRLV